MIDTPIFIGGIERSGTSLVRAIIGSHPEVAIYEWDLQLWTRYFNQYKNLDLRKSDNLDNLINVIFNDKKVRNCDIRMDKMNVKQRIFERLCHGITIGFVFQCFLEEYAIAVNKPRWGLKTPYNEFFADDIFNAYPNARMVQIIRDPRDVAVSFQSYNDGAWSFQPLKHIASWQESVFISLRNEKKYKGRYITITYEQLVREPEQVTRKVCDILDLDYTPVMLDTNGHLGWNGSNSFFDDIGRQSNSIKTSAIGRYQTQLQPHLVYLYQKRLRTQLKHMGYNIKEFNYRSKVIINIMLLRQKMLQPMKHFLSGIATRSVEMLRNTPIFVPARTLYRKLLKL